MFVLFVWLTSFAKPWAYRCLSHATVPSFLPDAVFSGSEKLSSLTNCKEVLLIG